MKLLLDTPLLLWAAADSDRLSTAARRLIGDAGNERFFSAASLRELAIEHTLGREDFKVDLSDLRDGLLGNAYTEVPVQSAHAIAALTLPAIHKDPFARILVAQAMAEGMTLLTGDSQVAQYSGSVRKV